MVTINISEMYKLSEMVVNYNKELSLEIAPKWIGNRNNENIGDFKLIKV